MGTKSIDSIQTEQIEYLEADVTELLGKTNLMVGDINVLVPMLNDSINNLKNLIAGVRGSGGYPDYPGNVGDGALTRLKDFDDYYTEHISSKFPPMVDYRGIPRIGYKSGGVKMPLTHRAGSESQMFSDGWECQDGTVVTATVTARLTGTDPLPSSYYPGTISNVRFLPTDMNESTLFEDTYGSLPTFWNTWNWPICEITLDSSGGVTNVNFDWNKVTDPTTYHPNNSQGYGWSVNDTMHSGFGPSTPYPYNPTTPPFDAEHHRWFNATVTSVGSQCIQLPVTNAGELRSPATEYAWQNGFVDRTSSLFGTNSQYYGDDAPGMGGIAEPDPPPAGPTSETSTGRAAQDSTTTDEDAYDADAESASTDRLYKDESSLLFLEDTAKATRGRKLVRTTLNKLRSK